MVTRYQKTVDLGGPAKKIETAERQAGLGKDDVCRCKDASKMTHRELLRLMMSDLMFWKKAKR